MMVDINTSAPSDNQRLPRQANSQRHRARYGADRERGAARRHIAHHSCCVTDNASISRELYCTTFTIVIFVAFAFAVCNRAHGQIPSPDFEAFIQPYKTVKIATAEVGILQAVNVKPGQEVQEGTVLARLDDHVLQASLAAAAAAKNATGNLQAAEAELKHKDQQFASLQALFQRGNASQREMDRAMIDRLLCNARLQSIREEQQVREFEYKRIAAQIEGRVLRAPLKAVVESVVKEKGELVAPTEPLVMTLVQLDPLKAVFSLPIPAIAKLNVGHKVMLSVGQNDQRVPGVIDVIAPTADAQSGTVRVTVRIPNPQRRLLCGSVCRWLDQDDLGESVATQPDRDLLVRPQTHERRR